MSAINIRTDIFEHGVFPTPQKLGFLNIMSLFNSLSLASNIDNKVSIDQFKESISKYIPSVSSKQAEAFFILFKILTEEDMSFLGKIQQGSKDPKQSFKGSSSTNNLALADARTLTIYIFLQTFSSSLRHTEQSKSKDFNAAWGPNLNYQFNETIRGNLSNPHFSSPINSPRS